MKNPDDLATAVLLTIVALVGAVAAGSHYHEQAKAAAEASRNARYQAEVQRCVNSGRYTWQPQYDELNDPLRVYPIGGVSPAWQCMSEAVSRGF